MKVKQITLSTYSKNYRSDEAAPLYVVNLSDGRIGMNVLNDQNKSDVVIVERTFAPVDLTASVPRNNILSNSSFRRYINKGMLSVVDNESVFEALKGDAALRDEFLEVNGEGSLPMDERDLVVETKKRVAQKPDNVKKVNNVKLDSLIMEAQGIDIIDDASERNTAIKSLVTSFHKGRLQYTSEDLASFIEQVQLPELRDAAIEYKNELESDDE